MASQGKLYDVVYQTLMLTVYNVSYTVALFYLLVFYLATKEAAARFNPVSKFAAVKIVVFATYYQSIVIRCLPGMGTEAAERLGDLILCLEMIAFSLVLGCAFDIGPYHMGNEVAAAPGGRAKLVTSPREDPIGRGKLGAYRTEPKPQRPSQTPPSRILFLALKLA